LGEVVEKAVMVMWVRGGELRGGWVVGDGDGGGELGSRGGDCGGGLGGVGTV